MKNKIKIGLLVGFMTIAGGLPFVAAQESFRDSFMKDETYQMPMHNNLDSQGGHCIDQMEDNQEAHMFNQGFENHQQHHQMHRGMWER